MHQCFRAEPGGPGPKFRVGLSDIVNINFKSSQFFLSFGMARDDNVNARSITATSSYIGLILYMYILRLYPALRQSHDHQC